MSRWLGLGNMEHELRRTAYGYGVSYLRDENVLQLDCGNGSLTMNILKNSEYFK